MSFRLSEREFKNLRELCAAHGIPSISDMARRAIRERFVANGAVDPSLAIAIRDLRGKVQELNAECQQLAQRLPEPSPSGQ